MKIEKLSWEHNRDRYIKCVGDKLNELIDAFNEQENK